jgi:hypothetical protein
MSIHLDRYLKQVMGEETDEQRKLKTKISDMEQRQNERMRVAAENKKKGIKTDALGDALKAIDKLVKDKNHPRYKEPKQKELDAAKARGERLPQPKGWIDGKPPNKNTMKESEDNVSLMDTIQSLVDDGFSDAEIIHLIRVDSEVDS